MNSSDREPWVQNMVGTLLARGAAALPDFDDGRAGQAYFDRGVTINSSQVVPDSGRAGHGGRGRRSAEG